MTTTSAPTSGTVLYDGDCGFCTVSANWLAAHGSASIQPWQATDLEPLGLTEEQVSSKVYWLDADGRPAASGAGAVAASLRTCRGAWPLVGRFLTARPVRPVADLGYAVVARNRHRLPGATAACRLD